MNAAYELILERFARGDTPPPGMALKPGTVASTSGDPTVIVDGDVVGTPVMVLTGTVFVGQRVMVLFWPPHGAYVIGSGDWEPIIMAEPGNLVVASGLSWQYVEYDSVMAPWRFTVGTAPTGANIILDVLNNGTSVFTTPPEIVIGTRTVLAVPDSPDLLTGDELTVDVLQIGSVSPGSFLRGSSRYAAVRMAA